jgi:hypothetical protein
MVLISCTLFCACELQQGSSRPGYRLLEMGMRILAAYIQPSKLAQPVSEAAFALEQAVIPFSSRHGLIMPLFGLPALVHVAGETKSNLGVWSSEALKTAETLDDYRQCACDLLLTTYEVVRAAAIIVDRPEEHARIATLRDVMLGHRLRDWRLRFEDFTKSKPLSTSDYVVVTYLLIYHTVADIATTTCLDASQTAFDAHLSAFDMIVSRAEALYASENVGVEVPPAPFELGLRPPLYFVAIRCRQLRIRQRALALLTELTSQTPRTSTSLWDTLPIPEIASRIIAFEHTEARSISGTEIQGDTTDKNQSDGEAYSAEPVVSEWRRVHHVQIATRQKLMRNGGGRELALKVFTYTATRQLVAHHMDLS